MISDAGQEFAALVILGLGFIAKMVYNIGFAWWLDPWLRRKANRALLADIKANLNFLFSRSHSEVSGQIKVLRSDWPEIQIAWETVLFTVTRWHDETTVTVAPRHVPTQSYQLGPLIAALERRNFSERDVVDDLAGAASLL